MQEIQTWPGWETVRFLGEGSFGKVYEIEHTDYGQTYRAALKVISIPSKEVNAESIFLTKQSGVDSEAYYENYIGDIMKEVAILSQFAGNTNVVSYQDHKVLHESGTMRWDILLRMELLTSLTDYVNKNGFHEVDLVQMGIDLCRALELCEKHGIIHRDIKLANIFVSDTGAFKLGDFGIARSFQSAEFTMSRKGSLAYMAPEVYLGRHYGHQADIYSLGMVMYTILNNWRPPFLQEGEYQDSDRADAALRRLTSRTLPPPLGGTPALQSIILRALEYDPQNRYQHASHMRKDLERYLAALQQDGTVLLEDDARKGIIGLIFKEVEKYQGLGWHFIVSNPLLVLAGGVCAVNSICYVTGAVWAFSDISVENLYHFFPGLKYWTIWIGLIYLLLLLFALRIWVGARHLKKGTVWKLEVFFPSLFIVDSVMYLGSSFITGVLMINTIRMIGTALVLTIFCITNWFYYKINKDKLKGST